MPRKLRLTQRKGRDSRGGNTRSKGSKKSAPQYTDSVIMQVPQISLNISQEYSQDSLNIDPKLEEEDFKNIDVTYNSISFESPEEKTKPTGTEHLGDIWDIETKPKNELDIDNIVHSPILYDDDEVKVKLEGVSLEHTVNSVNIEPETRTEIKQEDDENIDITYNSIDYELPKTTSSEDVIHITDDTEDVIVVTGDQNESGTFSKKSKTQYQQMVHTAIKSLSEKGTFSIKDIRSYISEKYKCNAEIDDIISNTIIRIKGQGQLKNNKEVQVNNKSSYTETFAANASSDIAEPPAKKSKICTYKKQANKSSKKIAKKMLLSTKTKSRKLKLISKQISQTTERSLMSSPIVTTTNEIPPPVSSAPTLISHPQVVSVVTTSGTNSGTSDKSLPKNFFLITRQSESSANSSDANCRDFPGILAYHTQLKEIVYLSPEAQFDKNLFIPLQPVPKVAGISQVVQHSSVATQKLQDNLMLTTGPTMGIMHSVPQTTENIPSAQDKIQSADSAALTNEDNIIVSNNQPAVVSTDRNSQNRITSLPGVVEPWQYIAQPSKGSLQSTNTSPLVISQKTISNLSHVPTNVTPTLSIGAQNYENSTLKTDETVNDESHFVPKFDKELIIKIQQVKYQPKMNLLCAEMSKNTTTNLAKPPDKENAKDPLVTINETILNSLNLNVKQCGKEIPLILSATKSLFTRLLKDNKKLQIPCAEYSLNGTNQLKSGTSKNNTNSSFLKEFATFKKSYLKDGSGYSTRLKQLALAFYFFSGPSLYKIISPAIRLPPVEELLGSTKSWSGFYSVLYSALILKAGLFKEDARDCILRVDVITLKPHLYYNITEDRIIGLDGNATQNTLTISNKVLVLRLREISGNWEQLLSYFFISSSWPIRHLEKIIQRTLEFLHAINLKVLVMISEQKPIFLKLSKILGITQQRPYFFTKCSKVYYIFDIPELMMETRDNFFMHHFQIKSVTTDKMYLEEFYKSDQRQDLKLAPNLTDVHLNPAHFEKSNIQLVSDVFSYSVAASLNMYSVVGKLPAAAATTANFIAKMHKLFDILMSPTGSNEQLTFLAQIRNMFRHIIVKNKMGKHITNSMTFLLGWKITISAVLQLFNDKKEIKSLNLKSFENFIEKLCNKSSTTKYPTAMMFENSFKEQFYLHYFKQFGGVNCCNTLEELMLYLTTENVNAFQVLLQQSYKSPIVVKVSDYRELNYDDNNAYYLAGIYLLNKCLTRHKCNVCANFIKLQEQLRHGDLQYEYYMKGFKSDPQNVLGPHTYYFQYLGACERVLLDIFQIACKIKVAFQIKKKIIQIQYRHPCPNFKKEYFVSLYTRMRIFSLLKYINKNI